MLIAALLGFAAGSVGAFLTRRALFTPAASPAPQTIMRATVRRSAFQARPSDGQPALSRAAINAEGAASAAAATAASNAAGPVPTSVVSPEQHNVDLLNGYRKGLAPLRLDTQLSMFALAGSQQYSRDKKPHTHFLAAEKAGALNGAGFGTTGGENQGTGYGMTETQVIEGLLSEMFAEGPGGAHYVNIMNPAFTRVGVAVILVGGTWYLTNDFSNDVG